ncbi:MAG TPA: class I SAM-dependent methyltransferase, partial [Miltoncostaeaceae bacterium]|nr:class I SAM-dependent methyltransferase [Miltoncostaeaceae bacterium]
LVVMRPSSPPAALLGGQEEAFARDVARLRARAAEFTPVPCPACGAGGGTPALSKWGFTWRACPGCRTLYMSPRPSEAVMSDYYADSENYAYWAAHIFPASEDARREKVHRPWLERITGHCRALGVPTGTLVEVGPGFGTFAALAATTGAFDRVIAVEPTPQLAAACRDRGVETVEMRVEDAAGHLPAADVVVAFEVIEHLYDPGRFVAMAGALVRPGGLLVLSCPNALGFDIRTLGAESLAVDPEHVNLFNPGSLAALVEAHGFRVESLTTPGRLDAEFVREAALDGRCDLSGQPFLERVLVDEWERLGGPFQAFLADHGLSSHMWVVARRG